VEINQNQKEDRNSSLLTKKKEELSKQKVLLDSLTNNPEMFST